MFYQVPNREDSTRFNPKETVEKRVLETILGSFLGETPQTQAQQSESGSTLDQDEAWILRGKI